MTLVPGASLTLADLRYDTQLAAVTVTLGLLPEVNRARAVLPAAVRFEARPGDPASLDLTGLDLADGGASATVLTGTVHRVHRDPYWIHVELTDASGDLAAARPSATHTGTTAADVVTALLSEASAVPGDLRVDLPLAGYVADQTRTAAEHVARLAGLGGCIGSVAGDGPVSVAPPPDSADTALKHGRELLAYRVTDAGPPGTATIPIGAGPADAPGAPDALRPSPAPLPDDASAPAADTVWRPDPVLRTATAASTAATAAESAGARRAKRLYADCLLLPGLRPGTVVEVADAPDDALTGPWLLTRVTHHVGPDRAAGTELDGTAAS